LSAARDDYDYRSGALRRRSLRKLYYISFPKTASGGEIGGEIHIDPSLPATQAAVQFAWLIKSHNRPVWERSEALPPGN